MSEFDTSTTADGSAASETEPEAPLLGSATVNESANEPDENGHVERDFFNVHDGTKGRLKGVYLDQEEQRQAERQRAALEDREPNYEELPATAGSPLVTKAQLVDNSVMSNPSMGMVDSDVVPAATLPVDVSDAPADVDTSHQDQLDREDAVRADNGEQTQTVEDGAPTGEGTVDPTNPSVTVTFPDQGEVESTGTAEVNNGGE